MLKAKFGITIQEPRDNGPISIPHLYAHRRSLLALDILGREIHSATFGDNTLTLSAGDNSSKLLEGLTVCDRVDLLLGDKFSGKKLGSKIPVTLIKKISLNVSDLFPYSRCKCIENASRESMKVDASHEHLLIQGMGVQLCDCGGSSLVITQKLSHEAIDGVIGRRK